MELFWVSTVVAGCGAAGLLVRRARRWLRLPSDLFLEVHIRGRWRSGGPSEARHPDGRDEDE